MIIKKEIDLRRLKAGTAAALCLWTAIIASSIIWNIHKETESTREYARIEARTAFFKDVLFRRWNSINTEIYVPVSQFTPPNPYLNTTYRDVRLGTGKSYTMVNPAYMTRQVHELQKSEKGILGHITSMKPIRPGNAPDQWEREALTAFEKGETEISALKTINGIHYMRLMKPLFTEKSCLRCHEKQGYHTGEIRGGISVSIPLAPLIEVSNMHIHSIVIGHLIIWLLGFAGSFFWAFYARNRILERLQNQRNLHIRDTAIAASSSAMVVTDMAGIISYVNNTFFTMWGLEKDPGITGKSIFEYISIDEPEEMLSQIKEMGRWFSEMTARKINGSEFYILMTAAVIKEDDNRLLGITFSFSDITMRKNAEFRLKESEETLKQRNIIMEKHLKLAQLVQRDLIETRIPVHKNLSIEYRYLPVEKVGGDYFAFYRLNEDNLGIFLCDVSGHGVASALFHSLIKSSSEKTCSIHCSVPADYLYHLNNDLIGNLSTYYITGVYATFEKNGDSGGVKFTFANGGHPSPILIRTDGTWEMFEQRGYVIGVEEDTSFENYTHHLNSGDRLFFYTDGIPETTNRKNESIGFDENLAGLFERSQEKDLGKTIDKVISELTSFKGDSNFKDDIVIIAIEVK